jgi:CRP/FNR family transcriptional regulator
MWNQAVQGDLGLGDFQCGHCSNRLGCLAGELPPSAREALDAVARRPRPMSKGTLIQQEGDPFWELYIVRSGLVETFVESGDRPRITGFHLPGDLIGGEAIAEGRVTASARALDTTSLCAVSATDLAALSNREPALARAFLERFSERLSWSRCRHKAFAHRSAAARVAWLLEELLTRSRPGTLDQYEGAFPIPKRDLADFLGLAPETVSRILAQLQSKGVVALTKRRFQIRDPQALRRLTREFEED